MTGQHRGLLDQVLEVFRIRPDFDLDCMRPGQTLASLSAALLSGLEPVFQHTKPSLAIVQGDTATALCGALSAFYQGVPVAHVEAGLRTGDLGSPFPEEMNRVVVSRLARLHFAPTEQAAANLRRELVPEDHIFVTGNTGIDAVLHVAQHLAPRSDRELGLPTLDSGRKLITVTTHRRESFGAPLGAICRAVESLAGRADVHVVWSVHPNPNVEPVIRSMLGNHPFVTLVEPQDYRQFVGLLQRSYLILTDSGGIQEEAPSLGKPVLVLRDNTERPEAVAAGTARLVGSDPHRIVSETTQLLEDEAAYRQMAGRHNPYGDGRASPRIHQAITTFLEQLDAIRR